MTGIDSATRHLAADAYLYPPIDPVADGRLAVDPRHSMYWEECGNRDGPVVVFLHGGPGGGCLPHHRRFFDPAHWRIVLFDQRGAGPLDAPTPASSTTRRGRWSRTSRSFARTSASSAWFCCSAARGARPSRWPTRETYPASLRRPGAARHLPRHASARSTGSCTAWAASSRRRGDAFVGLPARRRSARPARELPPAPRSTPIPPCTCPRPTPGTATRRPARRCCPAPRAR